MGNAVVGLAVGANVGANVGALAAPQYVRVELLYGTNTLSDVGKAVVEILGGGLKI